MPQAIGSGPTAALTNRMDVTKAAESKAAVSRTEAKLAFIGLVPFCVTHDWVHTTFNAGSVPISNYRYFTVPRMPDEG